MIDYYDATLDQEFMKRILYPFLKKVSRFDEDKRKLWTEILENLPPQPVSEWQGKRVYSLAETEFRGGEWVPMANPVPGDGNILPLESVKPANVIGYYSKPEELKTAQETIDIFSGRGAWTQANNFPKIYPVAVNVRYPAEKITSRFAETIRVQTGANLLIHDNIHGGEKAGSIAAVNDMLLVHAKGVVTLFPNWLKDRDASFERLRTGTFGVSAEYDGTPKEIK